MPEIEAGLVGLLAVNLVLWTGLFLYLLRMHRQVRAAEREATARSRGLGD
jgi:CcmD family protein